MAICGRQACAAKRVVELMENNIPPMVAQRFRCAVCLDFRIVFEGGFDLPKPLRRSLQRRLSTTMDRIAANGVMLQFAFNDRQFVFLPRDRVEETFRRGEYDFQIFCFRGELADLTYQRLRRAAAMVADAAETSRMFNTFR